MKIEFMISLPMDNFKVIFIEGDKMTSSLGFLESGWSHCNWAIYFAPRSPSSVCINEYMAIYSNV